MRWITTIKLSFLATLCIFIFTPIQSLAGMAANNKIDAAVTPQVFEKAKKNADWKLAFLTGKNAQIVFMNVSFNTAPNNEIGIETHKFDQVIFVVEGNAKAVLNGKSSRVKSGDMIFIPQGVQHNVINLNAEQPLKIISFYSDTDIPANAIYKKKSDEPNE